MTKWQLRFDKRAFRNLQKLTKSDQARVRKFVDERLLASDDPRKMGKALSGNFAGLWRYRIGGMRLVAQIKDAELVILVLKVGHRGDVYK